MSASQFHARKRAGARGRDAQSYCCSHLRSGERSVLAGGEARAIRSALECCGTAPRSHFPEAAAPLGTANSHSCSVLSSSSSSMKHFHSFLGKQNGPSAVEAWPLVPAGLVGISY